MTNLKGHQFSIRWKASLIAVLMLLALGEVATNAWLLGESHTTARLNTQQKAICKLLSFVGDSTQHGIDTNGALVKKDIRIGTKDAKADAVIRRHSISTATTFLIRIRATHC
jgi:hypothetical protein